MTRFQRQPEDAQRRRERLLVDVHASAERGGGFLAAALLAIAVFFMIGAYSAYQVTSRERADELLGAGIATTTELDLVIAENLPELRERAVEEPAEQYNLPGYPLDVSIAHEELMTLSEDDLRQLVLSRSVDRVYDSGLGAFDTTGAQDFGFFSVGSLAEQIVGQVTADRHTQSGWIAAILAVFAAIASVTVIATYDGFRRFRALGLAFALGALPGAVVAWLAGLAVSRFMGSDPYSQDLEAIINAILDVGQRNYLIVTVLGLVVAATGPLLSFIADHIPDDARDGDLGYAYAGGPADWSDYDEYEDEEDYAAYDYDDPEAEVVYEDEWNVPPEEERER